MQLTRFTDNGLRVLIYLCSQKDNQRVSLDFLSRHFKINHNHLQKVSQRLSQLGWITTARGKNGGIALIESSRQLDLATIISALETEMSLVDCEGLECPIADGCKLQGVLDQATEAFLSVLGKYRLDDLQQDDLRTLKIRSG